MGISEDEYCDLAEQLNACSSEQEAERLLWRKMCELLERTKRDCRPEFAERAETWMRKQGYLPASSAN